MSQSMRCDSAARNSSRSPLRFRHFCRAQRGRDGRLGTPHQPALPPRHDLVAQPGGSALVRARDDVGVGRGQTADPRQHVGIDLVQRVLGGVVEAVGPLDQHRRRHAHGRIGENVVVAAAAEGGDRVADSGAAQFEGAVSIAVAVEHVPQPLHQHRRKGGHGLGRLLDVEHAVAALLVLADHVQVDRGDGARQPLLDSWPDRRRCRSSPASTGNECRGGAAAGVPSSIRRRKVAAISMVAAAPDALSLADGWGWQRCDTTSTSSSLWPGMNAATTSKAPS